MPDLGPLLQHLVIAPDPGAQGHLDRRELIGEPDAVLSAVLLVSGERQVAAGLAVVAIDAQHRDRAGLLAPGWVGKRKRLGWERAALDPAAVGRSRPESDLPQLPGGVGLISQPQLARADVDCHELSMRCLSSTGQSDHNG